VFGPEHRDVATSLDTLASLKKAEHKPQEAAALYEQASALFNRDNEKAEPLFLRAIAWDEKALGPESPELGTDLNNLALLYVFSKRYGEAQTDLSAGFGDSH
jgi:tetratricopeptide (TPR) repeat protein